MKRKKFELTNDQVAGINFVLERMINTVPNIPVTVWFPIKQNLVSLKNAVELYREGSLKVLKQYVKAAEDGGLLTTEDGKYVYEDKDQEEKAKAELDALSAIKTKIGLIPLTLDMLSEFGDRFFTDWNTLEIILDVPVEEEPEPTQVAAVPQPA